MINKDFYDEKMLEAFKLMAVENRGMREMARFAFEKVQRDFENLDLQRSLDELVESDQHRFGFSTLLRLLKKYRDIRITSDYQRRKAYEKTETEKTLSHEEIAKLVNDVLVKKQPVEGGKPYLRANSTIHGKDGSQRAVWIDPDDPNMVVGRALTLTYNYDAGVMARRLIVNLSMVNHTFVDNIVDRYPKAYKVRGEQPELVYDDEFVPEADI
jgi:hypothetical protein